MSTAWIAMAACCALLVSDAAASGITLPKDTNLRTLSALLQQPKERIDLAQAEVAVEKMIDPRVDEAETLKNLGAWADRVRMRIPSGASNADKLNALNTTLYQAGAWNDYKSFSYDFDDPLGTRIENKLLSTYLRTRKGNCVSMPILYVVLGQKLGLDITLAVAPLHVFAKFHRDDGTWLNLETTSGGTLTDDRYVSQYHIEPRALLNGIYLRPLTRKESVGVMIHTLEEFYARNRAPEHQLGLTDLALEQNPDDVTSLLMRGSAYYHLLQNRYLNRYSQPDKIPLDQRRDFQMLSESNLLQFKKAERLGWHEPSGEENAEYVRQTQKVKTNQGG